MVKLRYGKRVQNRQLCETLENLKIAVMSFGIEDYKTFHD